jgi:hypothetical protein
MSTMNGEPPSLRLAQLHPRFHEPVRAIAKDAGISVDEVLDKPREWFTARVAKTDAALARLLRQRAEDERTAEGAMVAASAVTVYGGVTQPSKPVRCSLCEQTIPTTERAVAVARKPIGVAERVSVYHLHCASLLQDTLGNMLTDAGYSAAEQGLFTTRVPGLTS